MCAECLLQDAKQAYEEDEQMRCKECLSLDGNGEDAAILGTVLRKEA